MDSTEEGQMETVDEDQAWSRENQKKLLGRIQKNINAAEKKSVYTKGERMLAWDKVAFHPYTSEMCQKKWKEVSQKIRKMRCLSELVAEAEAALENPFQGQNSKIHPDIPKRPTAPNSIFAKENFQTFKKTHAEMTNAELFTILNKKYTALPEHKKAKYIEIFHNEQNMYAKAMSRISNEYSGVNKARRDRFKKGKGPLTPRGLWYRHERKMFLQANPDAKGESIRQSIESKMRWSQLPKIEKVKWIRLSLEQEEVQGDEDPEGQGNPKEKTRLSKNERLLMDLADGKPDKPPRNGYNLFCAEQRGVIEGKGIHMDQYTVVCSQLWKTLSTSEKEDYQRRCKKLKKEYRINMNRYLCSLSDTEQQRLLLDYKRNMQASTSTTQRRRKRKLEDESSKPSVRLRKKLAKQDKECYQSVAPKRTKEHEKCVIVNIQGMTMKKGRTSDSEDEELEGDVNTSSEDDEDSEEEEEEDDDEDMTDKENQSGSSCSSSSEEN
ncbi:hypothetical protein DPEC_G00354800 [Dallia pectoralis]|uniref:Uncharacterized protein n=1 Tax=Dallia pectoralis TaxID=75939 RepID=A0ACC2EZA8_DALPE|nr:hypothetical protein DPEC_G00354800 [Dallia pectoralis]